MTGCAIGDDAFDRHRLPFVPRQTSRIRKLPFGSTTSKLGLIHRRSDIKALAVGTAVLICRVCAGRMLSTGTAQALVHINVTVASTIRTLQHCALTRVRTNMVRAHTVGKASHTRAAVCMCRDIRADGRVAAVGVVQARTAGTLYDIQVAIAAPSRTLPTVLNTALFSVFVDEGVTAPTVPVAFHACAPIRIVRD